MTINPHNPYNSSTTTFFFCSSIYNQMKRKKSFLKNECPKSTIQPKL